MTLAPTTRPDPWLDLDLSDRAGEQWRAVLRYEGYYEVSSHGRIKSVGHFDTRHRWWEGRIRRQVCKIAGATLGLSREGSVTTVSVMHVVAEAFLPPKPAGHLWYHRNKNPYDNQVTNITSGTASASSRVAYQTGRNTAISTKGTAARRAKQQAYYQQHGRWHDGQLIALSCQQCHAEKPRSEFVHAQGQSKLLRTCSDCRLRKMGIQQVGLLRQRQALCAQGYQTCPICQETKPLATDFGKNARTASGYMHRCRPCHAACQAYQRHPRGNRSKPGVG